MELLITVNTVIACLALAFLVLRSGRPSAGRQIFIFFILVTVLWAIANYVTLITSGIAILWWIRVVVFFGILQLFLFNLFVHVYPDKKIVISNKLKIYWGLYLFLATLLIFSPLVFQDIQHSSSQNLPVTQNGDLIIFFVALLLSMFVVGIIMVLQKLIRSKEIQLLQWKFISVGFALTLLLDIIFLLIFAGVMGNVFFIPYAPLFVLPFLIATTYSITRYRLFGLNMIVRKATAFFITLIPVAAIYVYLIIFSERIIVQRYGWDEQLTLIFAVLVIAVSFPPLYRIVKVSVDRVLFGYREQLQKVMNQWRRRGPKVTIPNLMVDIRSILFSQLPVEHFAFYLYDFKTNIFTRQAISDSGPKEIDLQTRLINYLTGHRKIIITEEIEYDAEFASRVEQEQLKLVKRELEEYGMAAAIPVGNGPDFYGLILIGKKKKGGAFTVEDVRSLEELQEESNPALDNMILYEQALIRIGIRKDLSYK